MRKPRRPAVPWHCFATLSFCLTLAMLAPACAAQDVVVPDNADADPDKWLVKERWSELRYGLSIRTPKNATAIADTAQGDVMRWALPGGTRIRLSFARGVYETMAYDPKTKKRGVVRFPAKIDILKKQLGDELKAGYGRVINTRTDQVLEIGESVGIINYYGIQPAQQGAKPYLYGVALVQLDSLSVCIVRIECPLTQATDATKTFESMVKSIKVQPIKEVNKRIHEWLINGEGVIKKLTQKQRLKAMRADRLFRVIEGGKDIGYIRMWQRYQDEAYYKALKKKVEKQGPGAEVRGVDRFGVIGNAVIIQSNFRGQDAQINLLAEAVDAVGKNDCYWQIKSSMKYKNDPNNRRAGSWVETGIRGSAIINGKKTDYMRVIREGTPPRKMVDYLLKREKDPERKLRFPSADPRSYPSGDLVEFKWPVPKRAFLSPVDAMLVPAMLPNEKKTYAFGAYNAEATAVDIRVMRVEPRAEGGRTVYLRPVLDMSEQALVFDANNKLIRWVYPDGREMRLTTREELAKVWNVELED